MEKIQPSSCEFIDPVCLMTVDPKRSSHQYDYKAHKYHFCAESCQKTFESNPEKYLSHKSPKRKGLWGRYLDRLNKATGGQSMKCH